MKKYSIQMQVSYDAIFPAPTSKHRSRLPTLDKDEYLGGNIAVMFRKSLAALLIVSWVVLAAVDLLEDLDVPIQAGLHGRVGTPVAKFGQGVNLVNNIVESANRTRVFNTEILEVASADVVTNVTPLLKKAVPLHKLNRVFLI